MFTRSSHKPGSVFAAASLLIGSTVGAGIFGLPYVISQSGFAVGVGYLLVIGLVALFVNLAYGEVVLSTKGVHQLPVYVEKYLGIRWKRIATAAMFIGFYGALAAYLIEVGNLLFELFGNRFGGTPVFYSLGFFVVMATLLWIGLRAVAKVEQVLVIGLIGLVVGLLVIGLPAVHTDALLTFSAKHAFLPYGVVLFSYAAAGAVADMKNVLSHQRHKLKKAIIIGTVIPMIIYIVFVALTVGISGIHTTESAVVGLGDALGRNALLFGAVFGIISMSTSFLLLGLILKEVYQYDMKLPSVAAWALAVSPPLIITVFGLLSFVEILAISGALTGGINGIVFVLMHYHVQKKRERNPEYIIVQSKFMHVIMYALFFFGMAYELYMVITRYL